MKKFVVLFVAAAFFAAFTLTGCNQQPAPPPVQGPAGPQGAHGVQGAPAQGAPAQGQQGVQGPQGAPAPEKKY